MKPWALLAALAVLTASCSKKNLECKQRCIDEINQCGQETVKEARERCIGERMKTALACEKACEN